MGLKRVEDWPERLFDTIEGHRSTMFKWGVFDCCQLAAECVQAVTGEDVFPQGITYSSQEEAKNVVIEKGGLSNIVSEILGLSQMPGLARRGDIVMRYDSNTGMMALGVCVGGLAVFPALCGTILVPLSECVCCWRVG